MYTRAHSNMMDDSPKWKQPKHPVTRERHAAMKRRSLTRATRGWPLNTRCSETLQTHEAAWHVTPFVWDVHNR